MASINETRMPLDESGVLRSRVAHTDGTDRAASVRIGGALCALSADGHARQLVGLVEQGYTELRVELGELVLCTSHGLDCWDDVQHRLDTVDGRLTLVGATGVVRRVLEVVSDPDQHFCPTVLPAA